MTLKAFRWPPVGAMGAEWTEEAPVQISRSMTTGAERLSATQRKRRIATVTVSGLSINRTGAGYMEMLKVLLEGIHLVRLSSLPINRHYHVGSQNDEFRQSFPFGWRDNGIPINWTEGATPMIWYDGTILTATTTTFDGGAFGGVQVTGLPPNILIARPGEFVTVYLNDADLVGVTLQVVTEAWSNASGVVRIKVFGTFPNGGRVNIGVSQSAVFRPMMPYPRAVQPVRGDWSYTWNLRQIFLDEVGGSITELNPWPRT
jgi:hypothetical protein